MSPDIASEKPLFKHPWLRRVGWCVAGLLLLWLLGWLALPHLVKTQLESRLAERLGRTVAVGRVDFKPWSLELTLSDVTVAHQANASAQLAFRRLYIDMELQSLVRLAPVVDALQLDGLRVNLAHAGVGRYDVDDVLARFANQPNQSASPPLQYALYNLVVSDAALVLTDEPRKSVHRVSQFNLSVPFLSNLDSKREVQVSPKLAFDLNGSRFESSGAATPFAQTRQAEARLVIQHLDLAPYLPYWPANLPVRLQSGVLDADLTVSFEQLDRPLVKLGGQISAAGVRLAQMRFAGAKGQGGEPELLSFDRLAVTLDDVQPLAQKVALRRVEWVHPRLLLHRNKSGALNVQALMRAQAGAQTAAASTPAPPWQVRLQELAVSGGNVQWVDEASARPARLSLDGLALNARAISWPFEQPAGFDGSAQMAGASLSFKGEATDALANVSVQLSGLPVGSAAPYLAAVLIPRLEGTLSTDLTLHWAASRAGQAPQTQLKVASLTLDKLALQGDGKRPLASIRKLEVQDAAVDVVQRSVRLGRLLVNQPRLGLNRGADGRWMVQDWLKPPSGVTAPQDRIESGPQRPWLVGVADARIVGGLLAFEDAAVSPTVALQLTGLRAQIQNFSSSGKAPMRTSLSARVGHAGTEPGTLSWRGSVALDPLLVKGDLKAVRLPLHAAAPYLADVLNVSVLRADTSFDGKLALTQRAEAMAVDVRGDARLDDVQVQTLAQAEPFKPAEDLLTWKSLDVSGLALELAPGERARVEVAGTVLSDFYARMVLDATGRLNLQGVLKPTPAGATGAGTTAVGADTVPATAPGQTAVAAADNAPGKPMIRFGPVSLVGGRINFTDRFIQPNYSADLSELVGKLSAFSSERVNDMPELADLELRGRAQGTASLEVLGKINPLVQPIALDIAGKVRDLELAPLSTYSAHYAGYGIERGKLSVDVTYRVTPDGELNANNKIVLNQLKFGEQVPNAVKTLPVKLAVALLADRNGVIDVDLPISGSLNDPQFRLMPLVFKIIGNLIVKAITAPFSLLVSAFGGGGDELGMVAFDAGSAALSDAAKVNLGKVIQALNARPALKMTVVGTASLEVERDAYKRAQLQALVQAEKRRASGATTTPGATVLVVAPQEYPVLLKAVYKRADFPKPRNLIGMAKDLPVPEMEALLLSHLEVTETAMQALALQRGVAVRDYLASQQLPMERLFLGAAKAVSPDAQWKPHAQLSLSTQ